MFLDSRQTQDTSNSNMNKSLQYFMDCNMDQYEQGSSSMNKSDRLAADALQKMLMANSAAHTQFSGNLASSKHHNSLQARHGTALAQNFGSQLLGGHYYGRFLS